MKKPIWIGVEVPNGDVTIKICIGLNQDDGHEVSYCNSADVELAKESGENPWIFNGTLTIKEDFVFDENHNIIL
jgi:hypothetical protein